MVNALPRKLEAGTFRPDEGRPDAEAMPSQQDIPIDTHLDQAQALWRACHFGEEDTDVEAISSQQDEPIDTSLEAAQALWPRLEEARAQKHAVVERDKWLDAEIDRLREEQDVVSHERFRLGEIQEDFEGQMSKWESARSFHYLLRLPTEIRDLVWDRYFLTYHKVEVSIRYAFSDPITLVCKQFRREVINWLVLNRPLHIQFCASRPESLPKIEKWDPRSRKLQVPESLLPRIRHVTITMLVLDGIWPRETNWLFNLASGTMECTQSAGHFAPVRSHQTATTAVMTRRMQVVLRVIMNQGELKIEHFQWFWMALSTRSRHERVSIQGHRLPDWSGRTHKS